MERRLISHSQPQTLQTAVMLSYVLGVMDVLTALLFGGGGLILLVVVPGQVLGAFGIANDSKLGYRVAIGFAALPLLYIIYLIVRYHVLAVSVISLLFQVALLVLLLHRQSREYARIWFR